MRERREGLSSGRRGELERGCSRMMNRKVQRDIPGESKTGDNLNEWMSEIRDERKLVVEENVRKEYLREENKLSVVVVDEDS